MRRRALLLFAVVLLLAAAALLLPVKESVRAALGWMASHRESSGLAFIGLYVLATVCLALGIDPTKQNQSNVGRPIRIVDKSASPIKEVPA